jgi:hypothetical protein
MNRLKKFGVTALAVIVAPFLVLAIYMARTKE